MYIILNCNNEQLVKTECFATSIAGWSVFETGKAEAGAEVEGGTGEAGARESEGEGPHATEEAGDRGRPASLMKR